MRILPAISILYFLSPGILAQQIFDPPASPSTVNAYLVKSKLVVDGHLDEAVWDSIKGVTDFIQIEPFQGEPSQNPTTVKVLYSNESIYVGVYCEDSAGRKAIRAPDLKRDFDWRAHDTFAICINGFGDKRNSMSFATNPYGTQKDYLSFDDVFFDSDWNGLWKVRTWICDHGWYAEFEIPWKTLRYRQDSLHESAWEINFLRLRRASNEISVWSPYPRSFGFNRMEYAGILHDIEPPPPGTNLQINPYTLLHDDRQTGGGVSDMKVKAKFGGELKWVVNTSTTADLTINTDFAQADADVQVNNVSRFSVLFPEKRQFFLENASLFSPGAFSGKIGGSMQFMPFFSRRVGLSAGGAPLPVDVGMRLVNRKAKQNIGAMFVRQGSFDTLSNANIFVGRYSRNLTSKTRIGSIWTLKSDAANSNVLGGLDGFFRLDQAQSVNVLFSGSASSEQKTRGVGGYVQYNYTSNILTGWWTQTILTKDFHPDLGFVSRSDVIGTTPGFIANLRRKNLPLPGFIRSFQPGLSVSWFHQTSTRRMIERELKATPFWIEMQDGGYCGFSLSWLLQNLTADFQPLGIVIHPGTYEYKRLSVSAGSDPSRKISYALQYDYGSYYNGNLQTLDGSLSIIPIPHISLKVGMNSNRFLNVGTEMGRKIVTLYTVQGRFALNPRIQLIGQYQRNSSGLEWFNVRLACEYKPLSYVYFVVNSKENIVNEVHDLHQQGILKVSFLKQF